MNEYKYFVDTFLDDILAVGSVLLCGLIVCGIICIPYYFARKAQKKCLVLKDNGEHTAGTVIALYHTTRRVRGDDYTLSYSYEKDYARYSFYVDSQCYTGNFAQHKKQFYQVGDTIAVYYDRNNPNENCTERHIEEGRKINKLFIFLLSVMAVVTLLMAFGMTIILK